MNTYDILGIKRPDRFNKNKRGIKGGAETKSDEPKESRNLKDITLHEITNEAVVETYEPKITRPIMSIYEYSEVHTQLGEYLDSQKSIRTFTNDVEIKFTVNPVEVAFYLLKEGKWDATLDRGYELVSYSKLTYNPQWEHTVKNYFDEQHITQQQDLFAPLDLI